MLKLSANRQSEQQAKIKDWTFFSTWLALNFLSALNIKVKEHAVLELSFEGKGEKERDGIAYMVR